MTAKTDTSPKRHCMVVFSHYPAGETRVQRQSEALINQGFEVDIICLRVLYSGEEPAFEVVNGANVHRLPVSRAYENVGLFIQLLEYFRFFFAVMFALFRLYPQRCYQVIQVHNLPDFLIFAAWYPKLRGARLILDLHDLMPEFFISRTGGNKSGWVVRLVKLQEKLSAWFADHVITVTDLWRQTLIERGVPAKKVSVVMNVADDRIFKRGYRNDSTPNKTFRLFYHGGLVPRYGLDMVVEAVAQLREELPNLRFVIHGSGGYKQHLADMAARMNLGDHIYFSNNFCTMEELPGLISGLADVGVVPYRSDPFTDGILPTKLLEYTALGIPSIVSRTPVIEHYFDETMVEFFTAGDLSGLITSIRSLYYNHARMKGLVDESDKFNQRYNWSRQSADYVALVKRLGGHQRPA